LAKPSEALRKPVPGRWFEAVKYATWVESVFYSALLFFWIAPGFEDETYWFGWIHGFGFIALVLLMWVAILRKEAPYPLLGLTLATGIVLGPFGSLIGIELIERKGWGVGSTSANEGIDTNAPQGE
jgi:hypothetical protein